MIHSEPYLW